VERGGRVSYGADYNFLYRCIAYYLDKILKGTKPADIPVERAAEEVPVGDQFKNSETDWCNHSVECAASTRSSNPMTEHPNSIVPKSGLSRGTY
jgi:hypothetical protein